MEERERMLDTIMVMQEFNIKKDKQIDELEKENQALKDRWNKLKQYINTFKEYDIEESNLAWKITDKMQELEQGETDAKD